MKREDLRRVKIEIKKENGSERICKFCKESKESTFIAYFHKFVVFADEILMILEKEDGKIIKINADYGGVTFLTK